MTASRILLSAALVGAVFLLPACAQAPPAPETTLDRETFIATWIDLRQAALQSATGDLTQAQRVQILTEHGATPESMEEFARVRGADADYMRGVWEEVEQRMRVDAGEISPDSAQVGGGEGPA